MTINPLRWAFRAQMVFGVMVSAALLGFALYVERNMFMLPCPLCVLQRFFFIGIGALGLLAALHNPRRRWVRAAYGLGLAFIAAVGASVAARHVWLQSQPLTDLPSCAGQGLSYMFEFLGPIDALATVLAGSADCARVDWTFLGLSTPAWTLLCFVLLGVGALFAGFMKRRA